MLRVDSESLEPINQKEESLLQDKIFDLISEVDVIVFEGLRIRAPLIPQIIQQTVKKAQELGKTSGG